MTLQHGDSLAQEVGHVIDGCFKEYGDHLEGLEKKDLDALKRRIGELKGMQKNIAMDLEHSEQSRKA